MSLSRRDFLRLAGLIAGGATVGAACAPLYGEFSGAYGDPDPLPRFGGETFRGLSRMTFGPTALELAHAEDIGLGAWVEEQLAFESVEDGASDVLMRRYDVLGMEASALEGRDRSEVLGQLRAATLQRQMYSRRQLFERVVAFWTDHFNIAVDKGDCWYLKVVDDREVVRPHALGRFEDLLMASARSPAMLVYLDNQVNKAGAPNENYARELMELHTLGVDGGYSQGDVMELARCLTGWTVKDHFWKGEFTFDPELHDPGTKSPLGMKVKPAGEHEAERVLKHLAHAEATADHIAFKLVRRFVNDHPENERSLVNDVAKTFHRTGGDLQAVMRKLLLDGLVPRADGLAPKFKRPVDLVTAALRALGADSDGGGALQDHLAAMGQSPFAWPMPDGPPDTSRAWRGNLMPRWQFALQLARGEIEGTKLDWEALRKGTSESAVDGLARRLLGERADGGLLQAVAEAGAGVESDEEHFSLIVAGLVASPAFQWR